MRVRADDAVLIEQSQLALGLEHALDHEHHVGAARVIFVEDERGRGLQRPGEQAFAKFGDLLAIAQHDRVAADEVDAADMRVEVDADARPFEPRGNLFDVRRLAGAVIALHHHAAIVFEAGEDRERRVAIEDIGGVEVGNAFVGFAERRHLHIDIDAEDLTRIDLDIGRRKQRRAVVIGKRSEEHTSELQSLMRISYGVFRLKKKKPKPQYSLSHYKTISSLYYYSLLNHDPNILILSYLY